jgi:hypothetical protein
MEGLDAQRGLGGRRGARCMLSPQVEDPVHCFGVGEVAVSGFVTVCISAPHALCVGQEIFVLQEER